MGCGGWRTAVASLIASWNHGKIQPRSARQRERRVSKISVERVVDMLPRLVSAQVSGLQREGCQEFRAFGAGGAVTLSVRVPAPTRQVNERRAHSVGESRAPDVVRDAGVFVVPHPPRRRGRRARDATAARLPKVVARPRDVDKVPKVAASREPFRQRGGEARETAGPLRKRALGRLAVVHLGAERKGVRRDPHVPMPGASCDVTQLTGSFICLIASNGPPHPPPQASRRSFGSQPRQRTYEKSRCGVGVCLCAALSAVRRWRW